MDKDKLYHFFQGTSTFEEEKEIRSWIESSKENILILNKERKLFNALLLADDHYTTQISRFNLKAIYRYAAVAILTLCVSFVFNYFLKVSEPLAMQKITVPAGQRINIDLPDGSNVWLNANTTIEFPLSFNKENRTLFLDGEAFFDVKRDEKHPFIVHTDRYDIKVLGTKFNIESYSDSENFETTLINGKVSLTAHSNTDKEIILLPNQKAHLQNGILNIENVDDFTQYRWIEGLICFKNAAFQSIMKKFEKYYEIKIIINNKKVSQHIFTGKFRQADGVEYALRVLQKDISFKFRRDLNKPIIYIE